MARKFYPAPNTKAEKGEFFVTVLDHERKLFDLRGPTATDKPESDKAAGANGPNGERYRPSAKAGPCIAKSQYDEIVCDPRFCDYTFVQNVFADSPVKVTVTERPLAWTIE